MTIYNTTRSFAFLLLLTLYKKPLQAQKTSANSVDICVYGATSAGVIAAYTAKKLGKSVVLIEPGKHLGGMTTGGLGMTDIGNKYAVSGISLDFYRQIGKHYGRFEQWTFEPHVAKQIYNQYLQAADLDVLYNHQLRSVTSTAGKIQTITLASRADGGRVTQKVIKAKVYLDCTYEGDLMAKAGVSYTVGREANSQYNETYNGVQLRDKHQFPDGIDPYKIRGDKQSGLLWGISNEELAPMGSGDKKEQTYNIRVCLTNDPANRLPITKPEDYNPERYELLLRLLEKKPAQNLKAFMTLSPMPNNKTDINNSGPFSTDMIGMNWTYPEGNYEERQKIQRAHDNYTKGFFYFVGNDPRMPAHLRQQMLEWGYPKDEYTDNNHWTPQMYVREARRMIGSYVMTQANCEGKETVTDGVGLAAYTMDSHNCQRIVVNGMVKNEGDVQIGGFDPYPISYRCLIPKAAECTNLLVPVCLSATHIAYGSIRMEPVFMVLGQSSAVAACLAIDQHKTVQEVNVVELQSLLKKNPYANGKVPDMIVDNESSDGIVVKGSWSTGKKGGYGPSYLTDTSASGKGNSVKFIPEVKRDGVYQLYTYYPKLENGAEQTRITVFDGAQHIEKVINRSDVQVVGQTSGEWVGLGKYNLKKGKRAFVEISGSDKRGIIVADAILLVAEN